MARENSASSAKKPKSNPSSPGPSADLFWFKRELLKMKWRHLKHLLPATLQLLVLPPLLQPRNLPNPP